MTHARQHGSCSAPWFVFSNMVCDQDYTHPSSLSLAQAAADDEHHHRHMEIRAR